MVDREPNSFAYSLMPQTTAESIWGFVDREQSFPPGLEAFLESNLLVEDLTNAKISYQGQSVDIISRR